MLILGGHMTNKNPPRPYSPTTPQPRPNLPSRVIQIPSNFNLVPTPPPKNINNYPSTTPPALIFEKIGPHLKKYWGPQEALGTRLALP